MPPAWKRRWIPISWSEPGHGDKAAYADLAAGIADRCLAVARRILRDLDLAEDATQQALLSIWQDLPQLRDRTLCVFVTWHPTTTDRDRAAAFEILETLRAEPNGPDGIRIIFTLRDGWDTG